MTVPGTSHAVVLPGGERRPALGLGTWKMGESRSRRSAEVSAVRLALDIGYRVIDTAEMYGEGGAEEVVGEAVAGAMRDGLARGDVFIVSKVYPHNASRAGVLAACERSLRRLKLDSIDLYLLHWRGREPLAETLAGFLELQRRGQIRRWGVSNFDVPDLQELFGLEGGAGCSANQVYYSLGARGVEFDLLPWQRERGVPLMAYCPIDQGALARRQAGAAWREVAQRHAATPVQVALAALLAQGGVMAIPKAVREAHLRENWGAAALALDAKDLAALDRDFPPPRRKVPLTMS
ncbi:MAG TPA: aldo/keto reductase [Burkholderiaceae bacterium]